MKIKTLRVLGCAGLLALLGACASSNQSQSPSALATTHFDDHEVALNSVPATVLKTAQTAVPGFVAREAKLDHDDSKGAIYKLEGISGQRKYEITVTAAGRLIGVDRD